jgi:thiamine pyrophosphokinase
LWRRPQEWSVVKAVIVASGEPDPTDTRHLEGADLVIAADGGTHWLAGAGIAPGRLIGDMDSVSGELLRRLEASGTRIERHPTAKDASDLALAVERVLSLGADEVVILGALQGDRLDHELANVLLLADPVLMQRVRIERGATTVRSLADGGRLELGGRSGDRVTLLPVGGPAVGIRTEGLRYPLEGETLPLGSTRGLSNEIVAPSAWVQLDKGVLLVIEERSREPSQQEKGVVP